MGTINAYMRIRLFVIDLIEMKKLSLVIVKFSHRFINQNFYRMNIRLLPSDFFEHMHLIASESPAHVYRVHLNRISFPLKLPSCWKEKRTDFVEEIDNPKKYLKRTQ